MADDIESYWEDIRFYPPEPVDPRIQLRAEDLARKDLVKESGLTEESTQMMTLNELREVVRALRPR